MAALFSENHAPFSSTKVLGQGLFAATYLARHEKSDLDVVIRVLRPELALQPRLRADFLDQVKRAVRYVHECLVLTRDVGQFAERNINYCVRDYVPGVTWQTALEDAKTYNPNQIVQITRSVANALRPVHAKNEVHNGVKPSNICYLEQESTRYGGCMYTYRIELRHCSIRGGSDSFDPGTKKAESA